MQSEQRTGAQPSNMDWHKKTAIAAAKLLVPVLFVLVLVVVPSQVDSPANPQSSEARESRRADACNAPSLQDTTMQVLYRARRLNTTRPTCEQIAAADNARRVAQIIGGPAGWDYLFPIRHGEEPNGAKPYTYDNFLTAVTNWPEFCGDNVGPFYPTLSPEEACRRELAVLFANMVQEVGARIPQAQEPNNIPEWRQGLYHLSEIGCFNGRTACRYGICTGWQGDAFPCDVTKGYYGRGPMQLSWNYNYGALSTALFGDETVLLQDPDRIIDDSWIAFASALWFFMTPQPPKPSNHDVVYGHYVPNQADFEAGRIPGFGVQIMLINGALECGRTATSQDAAKAQRRGSFYIAFAEYFGVDRGSHLACTTMAPFDEASSAHLPDAYWDLAESGGDCACQAVAYDRTGDRGFDHPLDIDRSYCSCVGRLYSAAQCPAVGGTRPTPFPAELRPQACEDVTHHLHATTTPSPETTTPPPTASVPATTAADPDKTPPPDDPEDTTAPAAAPTSSPVPEPETTPAPEVGDYVLRATATLAGVRPADFLAHVGAFQSAVASLHPRQAATDVVVDQGSVREVSVAGGLVETGGIQVSYEVQNFLTDTLAIRGRMVQEASGNTIVAALRASGMDELAGITEELVVVDGAGNTVSVPASTPESGALPQRGAATSAWRGACAALVTAAMLAKVRGLSE